MLRVGLEIEEPVVGQRVADRTVEKGRLVRVQAGFLLELHGEHATLELAPTCAHPSSTVFPSMRLTSR